MKLFCICSTSFDGLSSSEKQDELRYIDMLTSVIAGKKGTPPCFYYSLEYPLAISQQRHYNVKEKKKTTSNNSSFFWTLSDDRFFWNKNVMQEFITKGLDHWIVPVINGFVNVSTDCEVNGVKFDFLFITRRAWTRIGTRFCVRGAGISKSFFLVLRNLKKIGE